MLIPCFKCGSRKTEEMPKEYINHIICESKIICKNCGEELNYWAYGYYQEPNTIKELITWKPYSILLRLKILIKSFYWIIKVKYVQ